MQTSLERLAALGASVQNSLPPMINELLERGDRPVAVNGEISGAAYHDNPYLSEGMDPCMIELLSHAKEQVSLSNGRRERFKRAAAVFNLVLNERFPTIPPCKKYRITVPVTWIYSKQKKALHFDLAGFQASWSFFDAVIPPDTKMVSVLEFWLVIDSSVSLFFAAFEISY